MKKEQNLVWIDLEMTGLDPETDTILEIATVVTDAQLNVLGEGPDLVIHQPDSVLSAMKSVVQVLHARSGLLNDVKRSTVTMRDAEKETLAFIKQYCSARMAPLCGNTVWMDGAFMRHYMPRITDHLHYRIVDVSSIKELLGRWYPDNKHLDFKKKDSHRALADIYESIEELKHYRTYFFTANN
jgi:oligoribonuclease